MVTKIYFKKSVSLYKYLTLFIFKISLNEIIIHRTILDFARHIREPSGYLGFRILASVRGTGHWFGQMFLNLYLEMLIGFYYHLGSL